MLKKTSTKIVLVFMALAMIAAGLIFYQRSPRTTVAEPAIIELGSETAPEPASIFYQAVADGQNAFELLKINAQIEYQEYDFGVFVESINGIKADEQHFWALYVNGEQALTGADQTNLNQNDQVEWRYEAIK